MDASQWAHHPVDLRIASCMDGAYTAVAPAADLDLTGWRLVAVDQAGQVLDHSEFAWTKTWASWTLGPISPAWEAYAEFKLAGRWRYGLQSPSGKLYEIDEPSGPGSSRPQFRGI